MNRNDLTVVSGLFDANGLFISATQKFVEMNLKDQTATRRIGVKLTFDVKPGGTYFVRLVVRDSQGQLMSARNGSVEIP